MDLAAILRQIDAELDRLEAIRNIVSSLASPAPRIKIPRVPTVNPEPEQKPEPRLIVLPARTKRERRTLIKPRTVEPTALAAPVSDRPVFVPKAQPTAPPPPPPPVIDAEAMEAALRRNFLGGAA